MAVTLSEKTISNAFFESIGNFIDKKEADFGKKVCHNLKVSLKAYSKQIKGNVKELGTTSSIVYAGNLIRLGADNNGIVTPELIDSQYKEMQNKQNATKKPSIEKISENELKNLNQVRKETISLQQNKVSKKTEQPQAE